MKAGSGAELLGHREDLGFMSLNQHANATVSPTGAFLPAIFMMCSLPVSRESSKVPWMCLCPPSPHFILPNKGGGGEEGRRQG